MRPKPLYRWNTRGRVGFTLIELMTVLVLMAILTAMIVPEMKGTFEDALLRSTSRELVNVIELASSRAISLNQTIHVNLDTATGRYQIERRMHQGAIEDFVPLKDVAGSTGKLDERISVKVVAKSEDTTPSSDGAVADGAQVTTREQALVFNPDGTADGTMILLQDRAGFRLVLRVNPITSRVSILEPRKE